MGDFWVVINRIASERPSAYVLLPSEVSALAHRGEKEGRVSYWLQPNDYDTEQFREAWGRIGHGGNDAAQPVVTPDLRQHAKRADACG